MGYPTPHPASLYSSASGPHNHYQVRFSPSSCRPYQVCGLSDLLSVLQGSACCTRTVQETLFTNYSHLSTQEGEKEQRQIFEVGTEQRYSFKTQLGL